MPLPKTRTLVGATENKLEGWQGLGDEIPTSSARRGVSYAFTSSPCAPAGSSALFARRRQRRGHSSNAACPPGRMLDRLACAPKSPCWWPAFALSCPRRESNRARARPANFVCQPPVWLARCVARSRGIGKRLASPPSFAVITLIHHTKAHITRRVRNTQELRQRFSAQLLAWK